MVYWAKMYKYEVLRHKKNNKNNTFDIGKYQKYCFCCYILLLLCCGVNSYFIFCSGTICRVVST